MNEMIRNNLTVAMMLVNVQFLQQLQLEWSRFVTIVKQQHKLDEISYHKLFDILKQYQKEVNELSAERLARNANPLALVATAQANQDPYYQTSKSQKSYAPSSKPSIPTRSHTTNKYKGKKIAKPITPPSDFYSDLEQAQRDKDMKKNLALIAKYFKRIYKPTNNNLRTSSNLRNKNVDTTLRYKNDNQSRQFGSQRTCFNCKEFGHFAKKCRKPKRVKDSAYHKEKMLLCKQAEKGVPLQSEQFDLLADMDEEINKQELKAHYSYMEKIQEFKFGSENCPPMLNKENYVPWSSSLLRYAKSRPDGKLIHNSIINGLYVRRMIPEQGDLNRKVPTNKTFHVQIDDEPTEKELKHIEADDQAIQTILLGLPKDIYASVDSCETAQEIWLRVQQMMKGFVIRIQEKKAKLFNE
uniref:CCHC-type domain-containing protein n=1 Tax=Tanacetum cinerariifolium TaxID=118510 RepID=A0A6L2MYU8_TANCI|nr:hypothetical protein [Tanacetum cinerariifolium]